MVSNVSEEVSKLLFITFRGEIGAKFSKEDISRMWSLDLQWFSPKDASLLVDNLCELGWLIGDKDSLSPCEGSLMHVPELGWQPFLNRSPKIPSPPVSLINKQEETNSSKNSRTDPAPDPPGTESSEAGFGKMASIISSQSGLERQEVIRRAKRKKRALGPVSIRTSLLLLAREQNLEMGEVLRATLNDYTR